LAILRGSRAINNPRITRRRFEKKISVEKEVM